MSLPKKSLLKKKKTIRRIHLYNWLPYNNILNEWSVDYNFFQNYWRCVLVKNTFLFTKIIFYPTVLKSKNYIFTKKVLPFYGVFCRKKTSHYFLSYKSNKTFSPKIKFFSVFFLSFQNLQNTGPSLNTTNFKISYLKFSSLFTCLGLLKKQQPVLVTFFKTLFLRYLLLFKNFSKLFSTLLLFSLK